MRKIQLLTLMLVVVGAFSALTSASAFALTFEKAKWLVNGAEASGQLTDTSGELLFLNLKNGGELRCSGLFEGTVEAAGKDLTTMVYSLEVGAEKQRLIEELAGEGVLCEALKVCEKLTPNDAEIWATGLPWTTEALLDTENNLSYELIENGAYHIKCLAVGGLVTAEELCTTPDATVEVLNVTGGVEAMEVPFEPEAECNGEAAAGQVTPVAGNLTTATGGTLTISE